LNLNNLIIIDTIILALWLMLPAYITNMSAALFRGKIPIDRGIYFGKNRLLGDGKTFEGLVNGITCGLLSGIFLHLFVAEYLNLHSFGDFTSLSFLVTLVCLTAGAMLGDLFGSLIKRRVGLKPGAPLPIVDQLDFVAGAWLLLFLFMREWFIGVFSLEIIITVIVITLPLHLFTNYIGFTMGKKEVPW